jgi:hypothetical protein
MLDEDMVAVAARGREGRCLVGRADASACSREGLGIGRADA